MKTINSIILSSITVFNILSYNVDVIQGIRGGVDPPVGKFTYQAIVLINNVYACGGAVVNSGNILSAGQCVLNDEGNFFDVTFEVIVGVTSFHPSDTSGKIKVDYIYVKNNFRPSGSSPTGHSFPGTLERGDLAVLKLRVLISNQLNVNAIQLPPLSHGVYLKYAFKTLAISGFGLNTGVVYQSSSNLSNIGSRLHLFGQLTFTEATVLNDHRCRGYYRDVRDEHICAKSDTGLEAAGPCLGDAGGPLVWDNILVGVLQYYIDNCDSRSRPAVYTRVSSHITFIENARDNSYQSDMRLGNYTGPHVIEEPHVPRG